MSALARRDMPHLGADRQARHLKRDGWALSGERGRHRLDPFAPSPEFIRQSARKRSRLSAEDFERLKKRSEDAARRAAHGKATPIPVMEEIRSSCSRAIRIQRRQATIRTISFRNANSAIGVTRTITPRGPEIPETPKGGRKMSHRDEQSTARALGRLIWLWTRELKRQERRRERQREQERKRRIRERLRRRRVR